jgi:hypothetical protein
MGRVCANVGEVVFHEHDMPKSSIAWNAELANRRALTLPLVALIVLLQGSKQVDILNIVEENVVLNVGIVCQ